MCNNGCHATPLPPVLMNISVGISFAGVQCIKSASDCCRTVRDMRFASLRKGFLVRKTDLFVHGIENRHAIFLAVEG